MWAEITYPFPNFNGCTFEAKSFHPIPDSKVHGANMGPPESCRPQMGPMLAPWTLLSGILYCTSDYLSMLRLKLTHVNKKAGKRVPDEVGHVPADTQRNHYIDVPLNILITAMSHGHLGVQITDNTIICSTAYPDKEVKTSKVLITAPFTGNLG